MRSHVNCTMVHNIIRNWRDQLLASVDRPAPCPLGWVPSVFTPVFYGYRDHELSLAAPQVVAAAAGKTAPSTLPGSIEVTCRVFYPTLDGAPANAPPLTGCATSPLIVFSHGQCAPSEQVPSDFYLAWHELPATLARAGYIVVVPRYAAPGTDEAAEQLVRLVTWARSESSPYAEMLKPAPQTGLVGHSYGAATTARVINEGRIGVEACAVLSPQEAGGLDLAKPLLWTWGAGEFPPSDTNLDLWEPSHPAHAVEFRAAGHHDYLPSGRAPCAEGQQNEITLMPYLAADIVALFFGRYLPQDRPERLWWMWWLPSPKVRISLQPAWWPRTTEQQFYAGGWFSAWPLLDTGTYDPIELHYWAGGQWNSVIRGD